MWEISFGASWMSVYKDSCYADLMRTVATMQAYLDQEKIEHLLDPVKASSGGADDE